MGDGPGGRPVAVPARDPGRADGRAAARRRRDDRDLDLDLVFGARRTSRFGTPTRGGGRGAFRQGSGRPGAPAAGETVPADRATSRPSARRSPPARRPGSLGAPGPRLGRRPRRPAPAATPAAGRRPRPPGHPRRAPVPRRRPRPPRPLGRRDRRDVASSPAATRRSRSRSRTRPSAASRCSPASPTSRSSGDATTPTALDARSSRSPTSSRSPAPRWTPAAFDYVAGGAWDELTLAENEAAWRRRRFRPRVLVDVSTVDPVDDDARRARSRCPVAIAPMAVHGLAHPDGGAGDGPRRGGRRRPVHRCRRRRRARSRRSPRPRPDATRWFQLYVQADPGVHAVARRAGRGRRLRRDRPDRRPAGARLPRARPAIRVRAAAARQLPRTPARRTASHADGGLERLQTTRAGPDLGRPRRRSGRWSSLPLVLKGILTAEDARLAVEHGVDAIVVSNHGARQLDRVAGRRSTSSRRSSRRSTAGPRSGSTAASGAASTSRSRSRSARAACSSAGRSTGRWRPAARPASSARWRSCARNSRSRWPSSARRRRPTLTSEAHAIAALA